MASFCCRKICTYLTNVDHHLSELSRFGMSWTMEVMILPKTVVCWVVYWVILLMGPWNPAITSWYGKYPIIYKVLFIPGGCLGFLNHQPYVGWYDLRLSPLPGKNHKNHHNHHLICRRYLQSLTTDYYWEVGITEGRTIFNTGLDYWELVNGNQLFFVLPVTTLDDVLCCEFSKFNSIL